MELYDYARACRRESDTDNFFCQINKHATVVLGTEDMDEPTYRLAANVGDVCEDTAIALRELLDALRKSERAALDGGTVAVTDLADWQEILGRHPLAVVAVAEAKPRDSWENFRNLCLGRFWDTGITHLKRRQGYQICGDGYDRAWRANHGPEE